MNLATSFLVLSCIGAGFAAGYLVIPSFGSRA
jgi:hypothetical protein